MSRTADRRDADRGTDSRVGPHSSGGERGSDREHPPGPLLTDSAPGVTPQGSRGVVACPESPPSPPFAPTSTPTPAHACTPVTTHTPIHPTADDAEHHTTHPLPAQTHPVTAIRREHLRERLPSAHAAEQTRRAAAATSYGWLGQPASPAVARGVPRPLGAPHPTDDATADQVRAHATADTDGARAPARAPDSPTRPEACLGGGHAAARPDQTAPAQPILPSLGPAQPWAGPAHEQAIHTDRHPPSARTRPSSQPTSVP